MTRQTLTLTLSLLLALMGSASQAAPTAAPAAASAPATEREADRADVAPTHIIGNRELPKVLYIVPWKKPVVEAVNGRPPVSVLDDILAPVDRDVFARQVRYRAAAAAAAGPPPSSLAPAPAAR